MTEGIAPPYPADTRAKGWRLGIDVREFESSKAYALARTGTLRGTLLLMFLEAWRRWPCGSLPGDESVIRAIIGMKPATWARSRRVLMCEWSLATDSRYYHPMLTERALEMLSARAHGWRKFRDEVLARDGFQCRYCGCTNRPLTLDHVVARSRGGSDEPSNLVPACTPCNSSKGAKTLEEWRPA